MNRRERASETHSPSGIADLARFPYRGVPYPAPQVAVEERAGGTLILRSPHVFEPPQVRTVSEALQRWAAERPEVPMLCQRSPGGAWRKITWGEMWRTACATTKDPG